MSNQRVEILQAVVFWDVCLTDEELERVLRGELPRPDKIVYIDGQKT